METKRQEYLSVVFRNIGFALFTPLGSLLFQWLVFKKNFLTGHFYHSAIVLFLGWIFIMLGYIILREKVKK